MDLIYNTEEKIRLFNIKQIQINLILLRIKKIISFIFKLSFKLIFYSMNFI